MESPPVASSVCEMNHRDCCVLRPLIAMGLGWSLMVGAAPVNLLTASALPSSPLMAQSAPQQRGKLRVGVKDNLRPLGFRDDQGELQGLEIAIARRLAWELFGNETAVELIPVKNQDRLPWLLAGRVDCLIANLGQTPARQRLVDFSAPYYLNSIGVITANPHLTQRHNFRQARLAVLNNSEAIAVIKQTFPAATLVGVESYQEAQRLLAAGQVEGFAGDNVVLTGWAQTDSTRFHLPLLLTADPLAIAMPKGQQHAAFRQQVNQAVLRLTASGWLQQQWQHWGLPLLEE